MRLTLFDLDHTLIPFDSTMLWTRYLIARGVCEPDFEQRYLDHCRQYVAGLLDIAGLQQCALEPLARRTRAEALAWQQGFADEALPACLPAAALALVRHHLAAGECCCLVTATCDLVAAPFARALGLPVLIASEAEVIDGCFTGGVRGEPCHGMGKVRSVLRWLAGSGLAWSQLEHSRFYSDSLSDLPLLAMVAEAIAVKPDAALHAHAREAGWRVLETLAQALPEVR